MASLCGGVRFAFVRGAPMACRAAQDNISVQQEASKTQIDRERENWQERVSSDWGIDREKKSSKKESQDIGEKEGTPSKRSTDSKSAPRASSSHRASQASSSNQVSRLKNRITQLEGKNLLAEQLRECAEARAAQVEARVIELEEILKRHNLDKFIPPALHRALVVEDTCVQNDSNKLIDASFEVGEKVWRRDGDEDWRTGYVVSVEPLRVSVRDGLCAQGFAWDEVAPLTTPVSPQALCEDLETKVSQLRIYEVMENTPFADLLKSGCLAVVKQSYFENCLAQGIPFKDRQGILDESQDWFYQGDEVMKNWKQFGAMFLIIVSYAWLSKGHPDPDMFHLQRLVRILKDWQHSCRTENGWRGGCKYYPGKDLGDIGVIIDYCSLWQRRGEVDTRTEEQRRQFKAGLSEINTPYAHKEIVTMKLTAVPSQVSRKYDDRGWTLFESILTDAKNRSEMICGKVHGERNVLTFGDSFDPKGEFSMTQASDAVRSPPCSPAKFEEMMKERKERAKEKRVDLFTNGKDQSFLLNKYCVAFAEQVRSEKLHFIHMKWNAEQWEQFAEVLVYYKSLTQLDLLWNNMEDAVIVKVAEALPSMTDLKVIQIQGNRFGDLGTQKLADALPSLHKLETAYLGSNMIGDIAGEAFAAALLKIDEDCNRINKKLLLGLEGNRIGEAGKQMLRDVKDDLQNLQLELQLERSDCPWSSEYKKPKDKAKAAQT